MKGNDAQTTARLISFSMLGLALLVFTATARLLYEGRQHLNEASRLLSAGERRAAMVELEDAAKAYVPGSPYPGRALRELEVLAGSAEMRGDISQAAVTWEIVRRSVLATRHFFQPHEEYLKKAELEMARLLAKKDGQVGTAAKPVPRPDDPNPFASLLLFVGTMGWLGGAVALCLVSLRTGSTRFGIRRYAWFACLGGLALWIIMAWIAG